LYMLETAAVREQQISQQQSAADIRLEMKSENF